MKAPFEFDKHGELIKPELFGLDVIVMISNENSDAKVTLRELTLVYPDLNK